MRVSVKARLSMAFRFVQVYEEGYDGRYAQCKEIGEEVSKKFVALLSDIAGPEKPAAWEGKWYNVVLSTKAKKKEQ